MQCYTKVALYTSPSKTRIILRLFCGLPLQVHHCPTQEHFLYGKLNLCYDPFAQLSYMEVSQNFFEAMKACTYLGSTSIASKLHGQLISTGLPKDLQLPGQFINQSPHSQPGISKASPSKSGKHNIKYVFFSLMRNERKQ
ncbi:hypothetical protein Csa_022802 [Cucumis sativus]|nr:hypothetical protein Csa_022802 [Cucumis sativus]